MISGLTSATSLKFELVEVLVEQKFTADDVLICQTQVELKTSSAALCFQRGLRFDLCLTSREVVLLSVIHTQHNTTLRRTHTSVSTDRLTQRPPRLPLRSSSIYFVPFSFSRVSQRAVSLLL